MALLTTSRRRHGDVDLTDAALVIIDRVFSRLLREGVRSSRRPTPPSPLGRAAHSVPWRRTGAAERSPDRRYLVAGRLTQSIAGE